MARECPESFIRWQGCTVDQLGAYSNLLIALGTGAVEGVPLHVGRGLALLSVMHDGALELTKLAEAIMPRSTQCPVDA
jgi:hypothetical protein